MGATGEPDAQTPRPGRSLRSQGGRPCGGDDEGGGDEAGGGGEAGSAEGEGALRARLCHSLAAAFPAVAVHADVLVACARGARVVRSVGGRLVHAASTPELLGAQCRASAADVTSALLLRLAAALAAAAPGTALAKAAPRVRLLLQTRDELLFAVARGDGSGGTHAGVRAALTAAAGGGLPLPCPHAEALLGAAHEALRDCGLALFSGGAALTVPLHLAASVGDDWAAATPLDAATGEAGGGEAGGGAAAKGKSEGGGPTPCALSSSQTKEGRGRSRT